MASIINASTLAPGLVQSGDASGVLQLQSDGVTGVTVTGANVAIAGDLTVAGTSNLGKIVNVYQAVKTDTFISASTSWVNITGLSVTVTPTKSTSKFLLVSDLHIGPNPGSGSYGQRFARNNTEITAYIADAASLRPRTMAVGYTGDSSGLAGQLGITKLYLDSPNTTSSITYAVQVSGSTTTPGYINRSQSDRDTANYDARGASSFTVFEIVP
jgi:hypothetical protein